MTSHDSSKSGIRHPSHEIPGDVADFLRKLSQAELAEMARQEKLAMAARPTKEERLAIAEMREATGQLRSFSAEQLSKHRSIEEARRDRVLNELTHEIDGFPPLVGPFDPISHEFWWAESNWFGPDPSSGLTIIPRDDGLRFQGYVSEFDGDLQNVHFGTSAAFELQAHRIPDSSSGQWRSRPHVQLSGGLFGYTHLADSVLFDDARCKCWLHLSQVVFQNTFGGAVVRGENSVVIPYINETGADHSLRAPLPGFQWIPHVDVTDDINNGLSLWSHVSLRFDVELSHGTLTTDPHIHVSIPQWSLRSLK